MTLHDEKALSNAIDEDFPITKRKLCTKHIVDNVIRYITDKIPKDTRTRHEVVGHLFRENGMTRSND